jgi:hypothetical protein
VNAVTSTETEVPVSTTNNEGGPVKFLVVLFFSGKKARECLLKDDETEEAGDFEAQIVTSK